MSLKASNSYQKAFILSLFIIVLGSALLKFPADDGLRHIGLAFGNLTSWGDVYPFSRFEEFRDYNPWFGYDIMLHWVSVLMKQLPFPLLATQLLLIKILPILFGSVLFHLVLSTSGLLKEIRDPHSLTLTVMLILAFLIIVFNRSLLMRPFILGTFFCSTVFDKRE